MIKKIITSIGAVCFFICCSKAQNYFNSYTAVNGYPNSNTAAVLQDGKGFIWLGSSDGLTKFDGKKFEVFHHSDTDPSSICDNNINCLFTDKKGGLWVGTRNGLGRYNAVTNRFYNFYHNKNNGNSLSSNDIWSINEDSFGNIWAGTLDAGINKLKWLNDTAYTIIRYKKDSADSKSLSDNAAWAIHFDDKGVGWVGTSLGINIFKVTDDDDVSFIHYSKSHNNSGAIADDLVWRIYEDAEKNIWIASLYGTLDVVTPNADRQQLKFVHITPYLQKVLGKPVSAIYDVIKDKRGNAWIAVDATGLISCKINVNGDAVKITDPVFYKNEKGIAGSLVDNMIWKLYCDNEGLIWSGAAKGLSVYDTYKEHFDFLKTSRQKLLPDEINIQAIFNDANNRVWLAAVDSLFVLFNDTVKKISFSPYQITSVYYNEEVGFFAGSFDGFYYLSTQTVKEWLAGKIKKLSFEKTEKVYQGCPAFSRVNFIRPLYNGLFIGGSKKLACYHFTTKKFEDLNWINNSLKTDSENTFRDVCTLGNTIWVATDEGLFVFDRGTKKMLEVFNAASAISLLSNRVNCLYSDSKNNIFIGTANGLNVFNAVTRKMLAVTENDGLSDNNIRSIAQDAKGTVWLATHNGLSSYEFLSKTIKTYTTANGLLLNQLNCVQIDKTGKVALVGSEKGINSFNISDLNANSTKPKLAFTDLLIHGKSILGISLQLSQDLRQLKEIKLNYQQNYFTILFASMGFANPTLNEYAYKLDGFDTGWVYSGNTNTATYTSLKAGKYIFQVRSANSYGVWNNEGIRLAIIITPPWWQTNLFYLACLITVIGVVYFAYKIRLNRILADHKMRNKIASDLHDDIGSSLSGISIYSELAKTKAQDLHPDIYRMLNAISENTRSTQQNMQDIVWSINPYNDPFYKIITRMKLFATETLEPKGIDVKFDIDGSLSDLKLTQENRKNFFLIFKETINNCAKYAACKTVFIHLKKQQDKVYLFIKDDGIGFNPETVKKGNGLNSIKIRAIELKAAFTLRSAPGSGTETALIFKPA